jgi:hypothetical protein
MAHGGRRAGAGRPKKSSLSPRRIQEIEETIKANQIIKRLQGHIVNGTDMQASAVTAALGLLRKVMPDLAAVETSGTIETIHYGIGDQPLTDDEWNQQFVTEH